MRLSKDRCLNPRCDTPKKPDPCWPQGDYWYCSVKCYQEAFSKYLDKKYALDKTPDDSDEMKEFLNDPEYDLRGMERHAERRQDFIVEHWYEKQIAAIKHAKTALFERIQAEAAYQRAEEAEKERVVREKEQEKLEKERVEREAELERLRPRPIPEKIRLEHTHILGPSGSGKTTLLQNNILQDFLIGNKINPNPPAYVIIDPKGLMVERLSKLLVFAHDYKDRIVIVDPLDAPALNLFQTTGRDPAQLISDFAYIFSTTNQKLTGKQAPCFSFCARLLFTLPHANLFTLLDLLDDRTHKKPPNPLFQGVNLPPAARRFFDNDYYGANYAATREEIKARIWGVLENDALSAMLNANTRKLDIAKCIRERKIVLVNTKMTQLKEAHQNSRTVHHRAHPGRYSIKERATSRLPRH